MQLLDEIVGLLTSGEGNLTEALIKGQVLAHQLDDDELAGWVQNELNGYPQGSDVPEYREVVYTTLANITNGVWSHSRSQLPLLHLDESKQKFFRVHRMGQSIAVIKEWSIGDGCLTNSYPPEFHGMFKKVLQRGHWIESMWGETSKANLLQILVQVRSRYLAFLLKLSKVVPEDSSNLAKVAQEKGANEMFKNAVFGSGAVVNVAVHGSTSIQAAQSNVTNSFDALKETLRDNHVQEQDIQDLEVAIRGDEETSEIKEKRDFGPKVKDWLVAMMKKAGTGAWNVSTKVAASVLTEALKKHYGY
jgi:hypothetical protein